MKKSIFMSVLLAASSMFAAENAATVNTNVSEDFTKGVWSYWNSPKVKVKYSHNKTEGSAAPGAAQITTSTPGSAMFLKRFTVQPSSLYQIEVMVKSATPDVTASIGLQDFGMAKKFVKVIGSHGTKATPEWQKLVYFFRTGSKTETVQVLLGSDCPTPATLLFDDFKMTKVDGIEEFLDSFAANTWGNWKGAKAKMKFSHDAAVGKKAPGSLKIEQLANSASSGCATKHIPVVPGKTYTLTVFAKTKGLDPKTKISLSFQAQTKDFKFLGLAIPSRSYNAEECSDWKQIVLTYKVPNTGRWANCRTLLVTLGLGTSKVPGTVWFDDFEFFVDETDEE